MNKSFLFTLLLTLAVMSGCSSSVSEKQESDSVQFVRAEGDRTIYALAADNNSDSILVFLTLPYDGGDPDTLDILQVRRNRKIYGRVNVGDMIAVLCNEEDTVGVESVMSVIVLEDFFGEWWYEVFPRLRRQVPDTVVLPHRIQEMLNTSREYRMMVKNDNVVYNMSGQRNSQSEDDMSPVVYPKPKHYTQWEVYNGKLVFTETIRDSTDNNTVVGTDTAEFVRMRRDTLILRFPDGEHTYYKKEKEDSENRQGSESH